ncbi:nitrogen regulation protein NR(II) [Candidatus Omnitrophota bacterium]
MDKETYLHYAIDITERKEIEKAQRLTQLGKLIANIAHEVNNPLMVISGRAQLSLMEKINNKVLQRNLAIIMDECQRAKSIIERVLEFSRPAKGECKETAINSVLERVLSIIEQQFKLGNVDFKRRFADGLPTVLTDEKQIQEVVLNLLNNARDAMPRGGLIDISTQRQGNFVQVDLKDNGSGMDGETLSRLFEPFFTTKEKGTGLGLPICLSIIKTHEGDLKFLSLPGVGTTATILLPIPKGGDNV